MMKVGDRVAHKDGSIGYIEYIDNSTDVMCADVRWQTPNNEPSCLVSVCKQDDLISVSDNVVPMQKNTEWWDKSRAFCYAINSILLAEFSKKED